jgi:hypothetical protein
MGVDLGVIPFWVWLIVLIVGLLLCFFGELIWEFMISILGFMIGWTLGFAIGNAYQGLICGFGLAFIFGFIFSMLFQYLAKVAVALVCAALAFVGFYLLASELGASSGASLIVGIIAGLFILVIAIFYVEEIVGVFLAAIGGFLIGVAVYFLTSGDLRAMYAGLAGGGLFALGSAFQVSYQKQRKGRRRRPAQRRPSPKRRQPQQKEASPPTRPSEKRVMRAKEMGKPKEPM